MSNLGEGLWERDYEKARIETLTEAIRNLSKTMKWTTEQAMDALEIPEDKRQKYKDLLQEQSS